MIILGLKADRQAGKSAFAEHLVKNYGFISINPFDAGKAACRGYYEYCGASPEEAWRMTNGDLKDVPSKHLPVITNPAHAVGLQKLGEHYHSRFFMEEFGNFLPKLGLDWSIGAVVQKLKDDFNGEARIILESLVYEDDWLKEHGGKTIFISAPDRSTQVVGHKSDQEIRSGDVDFILENRFEGLEAYHRDIDAMMEQRFGLSIDELEPMIEPEYEPFPFV